MWRLTIQGGRLAGDRPGRGGRRAPPRVESPLADAAVGEPGHPGLGPALADLRQRMGAGRSVEVVLDPGPVEILRAAVPPVEPARRAALAEYVAGRARGGTARPRVAWIWREAPGCGPELTVATLPEGWLEPLLADLRRAGCRPREVVTTALAAPPPARPASDGESRAGFLSPAERDAACREERRPRWLAAGLALALPAWGLLPLLAARGDLARRDLSQRFSLAATARPTLAWCEAREREESARSVREVPVAGAGDVPGAVAAWLSAVARAGAGAGWFWVTAWEFSPGAAPGRASPRRAGVAESRPGPGAPVRLRLRGGLARDQAARPGEASPPARLLEALTAPPLRARLRREHFQPDGPERWRFELDLLLGGEAPP